MIELFAVLGCAFFDRLRGDDRGFGKFAEAMALGACLWVIIFGLAVDTPDFIIFCLLVAIGYMPGWGQFTGSLLGNREIQPGSDLETWQPKCLYYRPWVSAILRGIILGLPVLCFVSWVPESIYASLALTIAFPVAFLISRDYVPEGELKIKDTLIAKGRWGKNELVRGALVGSLTWLFSHYGLWGMV